MESLRSSLGGLIPQVTAVIGSGGKTSLIWSLAQALAQGIACPNHPGQPLLPRFPKILVAPTTKMMIPPWDEGLYDYFLNGAEASGIPVPERIPPGITLAGVPGTPAKLKALPPAQLEGLIPFFDYVLLEGDGSRRLPLKAWAEYEPVIPPYTGMTLGLLPLWPVGRAVSAAIIHRLPLFSALSGAAEGEVLSLRHLVPVITGVEGCKGLFSAAQGKRMLFISQIEDERAMEQAKELLSLLPQDFLTSLQGVAAGSVRQDSLTVLYRGEYSKRLESPPDGFNAEWRQRLE